MNLGALLMLSLGILGPGILSLGTASALPVLTPDTGQIQQAEARIVAGRAFLSCAWIERERPDLSCRTSGEAVLLTAISLAPSPLGWSLQQGGQQGGVAYPFSAGLAAQKIMRPLLLPEGGHAGSPSDSFVAARDLNRLFGAVVSWNRGTLSFGWQPSFRKLNLQLTEGTLGEARSAMVSLKGTSLLGHDRFLDDTGAGPFVWLFPEGEAERLMVWRAKVVGTYEVRNWRRVLIWQAQTRNTAPAGLWNGSSPAGAGPDTLARLTGPLLNVSGRRPSVRGRLIYQGIRTVLRNKQSTVEIVRGWVGTGGQAQPLVPLSPRQSLNGLVLPGEHGAGRR